MSDRITAGEISLQRSSTDCFHLLKIGLSPSTVGSADWFRERLKKEARFSQSVSKLYSETNKAVPEYCWPPIGLNNSSKLRHIGFANRSSNRTRRHPEKKKNNVSLNFCSSARRGGSQYEFLKRGGLTSEAPKVRHF